MEKFKLPTLEELQKIFFPNGFKESGFNETKAYGVKREELMEKLSLMKSLFKCENCGACCKECAKHGVSLSEEDYERICKYLGISHGEFKRKYKHKFKKNHIYLQGEGGCSFYNEDEKKCDIYEVKPKVCSQYPFSGSNIKETEEGIFFVPCSFCYPYLFTIYMILGDNPLKKMVQEEMSKLPKEVQEEMREKAMRLTDTKMKEGLDKLKRDDGE